MSTALCPPHKTVHSAIIRISSRACRPALPVRGSSRPSKQAPNPSIPLSPPTVSNRPWVESRAPEHASPNTAVKTFQMRSPCHGPCPMGGMHGVGEQHRFVVGQRLQQPLVGVDEGLLFGRVELA